MISIENNISSYHLHSYYLGYNLCFIKFIKGEGRSKVDFHCFNVSDRVECIFKPVNAYNNVMPAGTVCPPYTVDCQKGQEKKGQKEIENA